MAGSVQVPGSARASARPRRLVGATLALLLAVLAGWATVATGPAVAGPVDAGWAAGGDGVTTTVSDGSGSAAAMQYNANGSSAGTWTFTTRAATAATAASPIKVPYTWKGLHAYFRVTATLEMTVNGRVVRTLVQAGPTSCCTSPSNGFLYGGTAVFDDVPAGATYGFRLSGSHFDSDRQLNGTLTLSTRPYLDATIGKDNRQWLGAASLPADGASGTLDEPGEARWFRFPVVPGQKVTVDLDGLPADYDLALYGDIEAAFNRLSSESDVTQLAASSAAGAPGGTTQVPEYPDSITHVPTSAGSLPSTQFAPRIYAPRIYAPRIYAPRIYAPRIYAPDSYVPDLASDTRFRDAFSAAQNQTLLTVSANTGTAKERVSASTGNTDGYFYVRVQGHDDDVFSRTDAFQLRRDVTAGAGCAGLDDFSSPGEPSSPTGTAREAVIVTDTNKLGLSSGSARYGTYLASLTELATATHGVVVDVAESARVRKLQDQAAGHLGCPYAVNLVARAVKDIITSYRNDTTRYVVIAGGDEVIPFFRYPDVSGLGQESQFEPPVRENTASGASLLQDQVQSQDAYGSSAEVTIGGTTLPLPDLAVGRLVKTPEEITSTIDNYLSLAGGTLPAPERSLVTGYDFLEDAAERVDQEFAAALRESPAGEPRRNERLITPSGTALDKSWTGTDLKAALLGSRHDLVYLAGHFSANDTLAADFTTTFDADELDPAGPYADHLRNTLVLSAGCHSGYNIVDSAAVPLKTNTADWTQRMAQQHAVLIGGTGYQYGDTDFLEYSERLYLDLARRLHEGPTTGDAPAIPVGKALALAKQDYLAGLGTLTGIDQKAVLQATLYGLPMTGFDAPRRSPITRDASAASPTAVASGPGAVLGLSSDDVALTTPTDPGSKVSGAGAGFPSSLSWLNGADGVAVQPGAPALPQQVEDVTVPGKVLRGVGFRGGAYTDTAGLLPLTGAPAIEGSTANTTFDSGDVFWPQRLVTPNYFGALGTTGRTSLVLTPAQYRSEGDAGTNTERAYRNLGLRLFYSDDRSASYGGNKPALAAPPSIGGVTGTVVDGIVTFSATVTGDPSAGVQQVWVTWTGGPGSGGSGAWSSTDLKQDPADSTRWTGTLTLPAGQSSRDVRFLVQAANGIGAVGLDTAEGDGYSVKTADQDTSTVALTVEDEPSTGPFGVVARVTDKGAPVAGRTVVFTVSRNGTVLYEYYAGSGADGTVALDVNAGEQLPSGRLSVRATILDSTGGVHHASRRVEVVRAGLQLHAGAVVTRAGREFPQLRATVTDLRGPVAGEVVTFTLPPGAPGATFGNGSSTATAVTGVDGRATLGVLATARTTVGTFEARVSANTATTTTLPMAAQYALTPFLSPFTASGATATSTTSTVPVKTTALLADGTKLSDAAAADLVAAGRLQVRWRLAGTSGDWVSKSVVTRYDATKDFFQSDLKVSAVGWAKGKTYTLEVRVLPAPTDPQPPGPVLQSTFDLGSRVGTVTVK